MQAKRVLSHGEFYGQLDVERHAPGFSLSLRRPDPERTVELHTHDDAHFILVVDGRYVSTARGAGDLQRAALLYNPPGTTHRDRFHDRRGTFFAVSIAPARMREIASSVPLVDDAIRVEGVAPLAIAQRLERECRSWERASRLVAEGLCLELLAGVARRPERGARLPPPWLGTARELLRDRCADDLTIADVARAAGVHPIHLARTFRRFFGCAPAAYLRRCRLERAAALLRDGSRSLAEIALECGFADQSHFTKSFREAFRVAPGAYRRAVRS